MEQLSTKSTVRDKDFINQESKHQRHLDFQEIEEPHSEQVNFLHQRNIRSFEPNFAVKNLQKPFFTPNPTKNRLLKSQ